MFVSLIGIMFVVCDVFIKQQHLFHRFQQYIYNTLYINRSPFPYKRRKDAKSPEIRNLKQQLAGKLPVSARQQLIKKQQLGDWSRQQLMKKQQLGDWSNNIWMNSPRTPAFRFVFVVRQSIYSFHYYLYNRRICHKRFLYFYKNVI